MATVEKPQPMDVDPKKTEEKVEEKPELVNEICVKSSSQSQRSLGFPGDFLSFASRSELHLWARFSDDQPLFAKSHYLL